MILNFEKYAQHGNEFVNRLEAYLNTTNRAHAARILRSTLRVLRNDLTFEESLQLLSQLPMAIKSVYVDGWKSGQHKKIKTVDDLLTEVIREEGDVAVIDFGSRQEILDSVRAVINTLKTYVSESEVDQALGTLPLAIREAIA